MGVLTIVAPLTLRAALANSATKFGIEIKELTTTDTEVTLYLVGEGRKCLDASAFQGVRRTNWEDSTCLTSDDHLATVKRSRRQA